MRESCGKNTTLPIIYFILFYFGRDGGLKFPVNRFPNMLTTFRIPKWQPFNHRMGHTILWKTEHLLNILWRIQQVSWQFFTAAQVVFFPTACPLLSRSHTKSHTTRLLVMANLKDSDLLNLDGFFTSWWIFLQSWWIFHIWVKCEKLLFHLNVTSNDQRLHKTGFRFSKKAFSHIYLIYLFPSCCNIKNLFKIHFHISLFIRGERVL